MEKYNTPPKKITKTEQLKEYGTCKNEQCFAYRHELAVKKHGKIEMRKDVCKILWNTNFNGPCPFFKTTGQYLADKEAWPVENKAYKKGK